MPSENALSGVERIAQERTRQLLEEGYTQESDAKLPDGSLAMAAVCYAMDEQLYFKEEFVGGFKLEDPWPWEQGYDKRRHNGNMVRYDLSRAERIAQLTKAGALIAAEIDNLLYKESLFVSCKFCHDGLRQDSPYHGEPRRCEKCGGAGRILSVNVSLPDPVIPSNAPKQHFAEPDSDWEGSATQTNHPSNRPSKP